MDYPQFFIPENLNQIINTISYQGYKNPLPPNEPILKRNLIFKIGIFSLSFIFFHFDKPLIGLLCIVISLIWIFRNPEERKYEHEFATYRKNYGEYVNDLKKYNDDLRLRQKLTENNYNFYRRKKDFEKGLKVTARPASEPDYKKGKSHNFFKIFLSQYFDEKINEDITLETFSIYGETFNKYIVDFAYLDAESGLCIGIEIDEPYTLAENKIIHFDDSKRNSFFIKKGWFILRFAEEQVILYPDYCCEYIKSIIKAINEDCSRLKSLKHKIPIIEKWDEISANEMIRSRYRNTYLNKMTSSEHLQNINVRRTITEMYKDMIGTLPKSNKL